LSENNKSNTVDVSKLSPKELHDIEVQIKAIRDAEKEKKEKLRQVKANYALHIPVPTPESFKVCSHFRVINRIIEVISESPKKTIGIEGIKDIVLKSVDGETIPNEQFYPCPGCGELRLYVSVEKENQRCWDGVGLHGLRCDSCDWVAPRRVQDKAKYDVWNNFHSWLIDKSYLPLTSKKPSQQWDEVLKDYKANHGAEIANAQGLFEAGREWKN